LKANIVMFDVRLSNPPRIVKLAELLTEVSGLGRSPRRAPSRALDTVTCPIRKLALPGKLDQRPLGSQAMDRRLREFSGAERKVTAPRHRREDHD